MNAATLKDSAISFLRAWIVGTLMLWIPGLFGWVHEVSEWADAKGAPAFPDPSNLAFLFVAALTAAFPAAGMAILRLIENAAGRSILPRPTGPTPPPPPA